MANENDKGSDDVVIENDLTQLPEDTDWRAKAEELEQKRREDGIRSRERTKALKDKIAELDAKTSDTKETKQLSESDYSLLEEAFFNSVGLATEDEQQLAKDFAKRTGEKLSIVVKDDIFKGRLEKLRTEKQNADATDIKSNRRGEATGSNSAEHWLAKLGKDDPVPSDLPRELRTKIVEARIKQNTSGKMFYND